ncbi:ABC transporter permease [Henriciella aquimarina]|uniref:ABC transporter permease n=1 Tax=Henriciella aquimarina TaxID=545261 RepID=UPI000A031CC2|nr:ABC transporter permease [Henriciella aquimarina]
MRSIYLVARRDYLGYVQAWGFWLSLLLTPLLMGLGMMAPSWAAASQPTRYYTVIDQSGNFASALRAELDQDRIQTARITLDPVGVMNGEPSDKVQTFDAAIDRGASIEDALEEAGGSTVDLPQSDFVYVDPPATTQEDIQPWLLGERLVETPAGSQPLFAAIFVPEGGNEIEYWSENVTAQNLLSKVRAAERTLTEKRVFEEAGVSPQILDEADARARDVTERKARPPSQAEAGSQVTLADRAPFFAAVLMAFLLWFLIFSVVNYLLMGTIEERSNKIFDSLLTSVKLPHMLAGKLLAVLAVALTLMGVWAIGATVVTNAFSSSMPADAREMMFTVISAVARPGLLVPAVLSFVLGYLMYGAVFLALGSLCDTIQEAQTLMTPLIVLLMVPMFMIVVAISDAESPILSVMSWIPIFTPFLLILRIPAQPPLWEVSGLLLLMIAATLLVLWLAARVYRAGAVHGAGVGDVGKWFARLVPGKK